VVLPRQPCLLPVTDLSSLPLFKAWNQAWQGSNFSHTCFEFYSFVSGFGFLYVQTVQGVVAFFQKGILNP